MTTGPAVLVRGRQPPDLDACVAALREVHDSDAYPVRWPPDPHRWLTPQPLLGAWVAVWPDGRIAGHVALRAAEGGPGAAGSGPGAEMSRLFVVPAARRCAVGTALVRHATAWAAARGLRLTLNVVEQHRSAAVAFYEATGWRYTHTAEAGWTGRDGRFARLRHYAPGESGCHAPGESG